MTTVKAKERFDEGLTEHTLEQAIIRGSRRRRESVHATAVEYLSEQRVLFISFEDHTGIGLPIANYFELADLTVTELRSLELGFGGSALCLQSRDLHVSIEGLVAASQSLMGLASTVVATKNGRRSSEAKARAARENGLKGGRPRKADVSTPSLSDSETDHYVSNGSAEALSIGPSDNESNSQQEHGGDSYSRASQTCSSVEATIFGRLREALSREEKRYNEDPKVWDPVSEALSGLKQAVCTNLDVDEFFSRSKAAAKWKAPWCAILLRETVACRIHDLLQQANTLSKREDIPGARFLLRSAFETLAILIYLNQSIRSVVSRKTGFHAFSETTTKLLSGSRDKSAPFDSINILAVLRKADKRYPGIEKLYGALSETAHPNHEGTVLGYSRRDSKNSISTFSDRWTELYAKGHTDPVIVCLGAFEHEYNDEFRSGLEALEEWIVANDTVLESTKPA